jgi:hypothetical protein
MKNTFLWSIIGFICFCIGCALRMYVIIRAKGLIGFVSRQTEVSTFYRRLVADNQAPKWPMPLSYVFLALGIVIVFGAILSSK